MKSKKNKKIGDALSTMTLEREKLLFNVLGECLADRLFLYFRGKVDFDYDEGGDGAYVECNLPCLFSILCLCIEDAPVASAQIRMLGKEECAEIHITGRDTKELDRRQIFENAALGGIELSWSDDALTLYLPIKREAILHLFANREGLLAKLDRLAKEFGIL